MMNLIFFYILQCLFSCASQSSFCFLFRIVFGNLHQLHTCSIFCKLRPSRIVFSPCRATYFCALINVNINMLLLLFKCNYSKYHMWHYYYCRQHQQYHRCQFYWPMSVRASPHVEMDRACVHESSPSILAAMTACIFYINPITSSYSESPGLAWEVFLLPGHKWFILWPWLKSKSVLNILFTHYGALYFNFISGHN